VLREPPERQGFGSFLPDQPPRHVQKLPMPILPRQATARLGRGNPISCLGDRRAYIPKVTY
jgi:hypothetical protein